MCNRDFWLKTMFLKLPTERKSFVRLNVFNLPYIFCLYKYVYFVSLHIVLDLTSLEKFLINQGSVLKRKRSSVVPLGQISVIVWIKGLYFCLASQVWPLTQIPTLGRRKQLPGRLADGKALSTDSGIFTGCTLHYCTTTCTALYCTTLH